MPDSRYPHALRLITTTIALVAAVVILFILAPLVWSVLQLFIVVVLLALALEPLVRRLTNRRVPRGAAVALVVAGMLLFVGLVIALVVPRLMAQGEEFIAQLPAFWTATVARFAPLLARYPDLTAALDANRIFGELGNASGWLFNTARTIFAGVVGIITASLLVLVSTIYTLLQPLPLLYGIRGLFPSAWWPQLERIGAGAAAGIRGWVLGTLLLGIIIGTLNYVALLLINAFSPHNIPFIETFAVIGGLLEVVPVVGPIIATALPALVGFSINPLLGVMVVFAFLIIQQLENNLIVPMVMQKTLNLHPVSLIFALVIFSGLFGLFGAIIAVPAAAVIKVLYNEWYYPLIHEGRSPEPVPTGPPAPAKTADTEDPPLGPDVFDRDMPES